MDRFIANPLEHLDFLKSNLKSNMDRFIVAFKLVNIISKMQFKIQYG